MGAGLGRRESRAHPASAALPRVYSLAYEGATLAAKDLGDPLALAIAPQLPDRFPSAGGTATPAGVEPNSPLEHRLLFQHHVFLASARAAALTYGLTGGAARQVDEVAARVSLALDPAASAEGGTVS